MAVLRGAAQFVWVLDPAGQSQHLQVDPNPPNGKQFAWVRDREEKGSDVNLATHLLVDASRGDCDIAVVVSDDGDLLEPIIQARKVFGLTVGVLNPQTWRVRNERPNLALQKQANFYHPIREGVLGACQFPATLRDSKGTITKPLTW